MPEPQSRSTFLTTAQLIERSIAACDRIAAELDRWGRAWQRNERAHLLMTMLLARQLELKTKLEAYLRDAPEEVLSTRAQYTVDVAVGCDAMPSDTEAALRRVLDWNGQLEHRFAEQHAKTAPRQLREAHAALRDSVQQAMRLMAKDATGSEAL